MLGGLFSGSDSSGQKNQRKENRRAQRFIEDQLALSLDESRDLYSQGDIARNDAINQALALMGNSAIPQMGYMQAGNVGAQDALIGAMPQYQNAILGNPVDYSQFQSVQLQMPDRGQFDAQVGGQPQQQQSFNPMQAYNAYSKFAGQGGGGMFGGGAATPGAAGSGAGGAASGSGGSAMASAGPWAALAAAIAGNETWANSQGRRPDSFGDHMTDLASGKVLEYDADALADNRYVDAVPGLSGLTKFGGKMGNPEGQYEVVDAGVRNLADFLKGLI